jgi:hypothetical protein
MLEVLRVFKKNELKSLIVSLLTQMFTALDQINWFCDLILPSCDGVTGIASNSSRQNGSEIAIGRSELAGNYDFLFPESCVLDAKIVCIHIDTLGMYIH